MMEMYVFRLDAHQPEAVCRAICNAGLEECMTQIARSRNTRLQRYRTTSESLKIRSQLEPFISRP
jgi:hypothetical protein